MWLSSTESTCMVVFELKFSAVTNCESSTPSKLGSVLYTAVFVSITLVLFTVTL